MGFCMVMYAVVVVWIIAKFNLTGFGMSNFQSTKAWKTPLKKSYKLLICKLADNASDEGVCFPSWVTLERQTGIAHSTMSEVMRTLEAYGIISRKRTKRRNGANSSNQYQLNLPAFSDEELEYYYASESVKRGIKSQKEVVKTYIEGFENLVQGVKHAKKEKRLQTFFDAYTKGNSETERGLGSESESALSSENELALGSENEPATILNHQPSSKPLKNRKKEENSLTTLRLKDKFLKHILEELQQKSLMKSKVNEMSEISRYAEEKRLRDRAYEAFVLIEKKDEIVTHYLAHQKKEGSFSKNFCNFLLDYGLLTSGVLRASVDQIAVDKIYSVTQDVVQEVNYDDC